MNLKAPNAEETCEIKAWTEDQLQKIFYQKEFNVFLAKDPTMKVLKPQLIGDLQGPVAAPVPATNQMDAIRRLMRLLKNANIATSAFDASELFDLSGVTIQSASALLFKLLSPLVGASPQPTIPDLGMPRATEGSHTEPSLFVSANESERGSVVSDLGSDASVGIGRMTLGPSGTATIEDRKVKAQQLPLRLEDLRGRERMQSFFTLRWSGS
ncbi:reverse transcriptase [Phytophthora cinnamomi]|uniref:reverse transcriptase n=1 Tax=Phytophthora cinnamomi TaxID=4785 RepID=UPI00355A121E|nr:reverse transcriptase [Phytophthora cinnamomi]